MELKNKICLVTGGTMGIGGATAIALAEAGADVAIVARRNGAEAKDIEDRVAALGRRCAFIAADVGRAEEARRCAEETIVRFGSVDVLVHAAGGGVPGRIMEITEETWHAAFNVHVHALFHLCRAVIPGMKQRKEGAIVLVSSAAGIRALRTNIAYQVVKGCLPQFTRALAWELADDNIRVNCVAPGVIRTQFHAAMSPEQKKINLENRIPLHREGTSEHVSAMICQLVANDYITGETVAIDGGLTMRIC
jgi:NAD(P)-dependent dehydrogenase (short-subunit alcohol dehydrogenase family)